MKKILLVFVATIMATTFALAQSRELQFFKNGSLIQSISFSSIDSVKVGYSLSIPTSVNAQLNDKSIEVSWTAVQGATVYQLYRSNNNISYSLLKSGIKVTEYTDVSPFDGLNYYKVKAIGNGVESILSSASSPVFYNEENNLLTGLYMGIIGFNEDIIDKGAMSLLAPNTKSSFISFVNSLTTKKNTVLYYGVDKALDKLTTTPLPGNMRNMAIITFTDGLDQGSLGMVDYRYDSRFAIGLRGGDVTNNEEFKKNLNSLASSEENAIEVTDMNAVNSRFQEIAKKLIDITETQSLSIKFPKLDVVQTFRFTFDNVTDAAQSKVYIEGTMNARENTLNDVKYVGLTCGSGTHIQGTPSGKSNVIFDFNDVKMADSTKLSLQYINEYYLEGNYWQLNSEFDKGEDIQENVSRSSAAIMLVLDCSSSLQSDGDKFTEMKNHVKAFIETLAAVMDEIHIVSSITLNNSSLTIREGSTAQLSATISPTNASSKSVKWTSSNTNIATVNYDGVVTAVSPGTCTITATAKDGSGKQASCTVTVAKLVTSISLNKKTLYVNINATAQLTATVSPSDATNKSVTWTSSNTGVATVNSNGVVTGVSVGSCTITATAKDGSGKQASCAVTVQKPVTSITLNYSSLKIKSNSIYQLSATVSPSDATNRSVTWASSNTSVATVRSNGLVNGIADGTCTITATANDGSGKRGTCTITVWTDRSGSVNGHDYVDLGLPSGLLWATCNVGASKPEEYGDYYAWGETSTKSKYDWSTYKYCNGSNFTMTKYCTSSSYGTVDNKTTLELSDDVARASWGGSWRMPTVSQFDELNSTCTWSWTTLNGIKGYKVTGPNGNSIFLPAADSRRGESLSDAGSYGSYWSSSLDASYANGARELSFNSSYHSTGDYYRCSGRSVRPVIE